jgi:hypothetical protein
MRRTGRRSLTERLAFLIMALLLAESGAALDLFTLWQRPELPFDLTAGSRVDYRRQALTEGRRRDDILRVQCLGRDRDGNWVLEVLQLVELEPDSLVVVPGEGLRLHLTGSFVERRGDLSAAVAAVHLWRDGERSELAGDEWRRDPLVTASFSGEFEPDTVGEVEPTVRVIGRHELRCRQWEYTAADTQRATLPTGEMVQISRQEVAAAVHQDIPLLGLAYVTERLHAESTLDPPSDRLAPPPPQIRVEMLECLAFAHDATPILGPFDQADD